MQVYRKTGCFISCLNNTFNRPNIDNILWVHNWDKTVPKRPPLWWTFDEIKNFTEIEIIYLQVGKAPLKNKYSVFFILFIMQFKSYTYSSNVFIPSYFKCCLGFIRICYWARNAHITGKHCTYNIVVYCFRSTVVYCANVENLLNSKQSH